MSIYVYKDKHKNILFLKWYNELRTTDYSMYKKINRILLQMYNNKLKLIRPTVKRMISRLPYRNLYKIRLGKYRLMFLIDNGNYYIMHIFRKKTQKTPNKEIKKVDREIKQNNFVILTRNMILDTKINKN